MMCSEHYLIYVTMCFQLSFAVFVYPSMSLSIHNEANIMTGNQADLGEIAKRLASALFLLCIIVTIRLLYLTK